MVKYFFKRIGQGCIAILGALLVIFVVQRLSGDPVALLLPMDATEADFAAMRTALGLDRPLPAQFVFFLLDAIKGDFGHSYQWNQPAIDLILDRLPDILDSDYVRMERAIGLKERSIVWRYALRNAAVPLATMVGVYFANMLSGAFVVEVVFAWPGIGRATVEAVLARDFPIVQAGVIFASIIFVSVNLIVDLSYGLIDPRIRHD